MKIQWLYNQQNEIGAYLFALGYIAKGYFGTKAFYVLPELPAENSSSVVLFPQIDGLLSPEMWEYALKNNFHVPVLDSKFPELGKVKARLELYGTLSQEDTQAMERLWVERSLRFMSLLPGVFTEEQLDISKIFVYPTRLGSTCAYFYDKCKNEGYIYIRFDMPPELIMRMILMIILRKNFIGIQKSLGDKGTLESGLTDKLKTALDFLTHSTRFKTVFPDIQNFIFKEDDRLAGISADYLSRMGFTNVSYLIPKEIGVYNILTKKYLNDLTQQEEKVLVLLINNLNELCPYEQLAQEMWGEDYLDSFSLYAISKVIHRLRIKLTINNINDYKIKTKRNIGYVLVK